MPVATDGGSTEQVSVPDAGVSARQLSAYGEPLQAEQDHKNQESGGSPTAFFVPCATDTL